MDIDTPPNPEISLQTVLDTVNRQGQEIEVSKAQSAWVKSSRFSLLP
jgi:hypothetical protein